MVVERTSVKRRPASTNKRRRDINIGCLLKLYVSVLRINPQRSVRLTSPGNRRTSTNAAGARIRSVHVKSCRPPINCLSMFNSYQYFQNAMQKTYHITFLYRSLCKKKYTTVHQKKKEKQSLTSPQCYYQVYHQQLQLPQALE